MAKGSTVRLTKFELQVMSALWALGSASVRELLERFPQENRPAYTTIQTIISRLEEKGAVRRVDKIGNAHIFEPIVTQRAAVRRLFGELLNLFGGSRHTLMAQLVETGPLTRADLRQAEETLKQIEAERRAASNSKTTRRSGSRERSRR
jgi:predicted transcriptional regulator